MKIEGKISKQLVRYCERLGFVTSIHRESHDESRTGLDYWIGLADGWNWCGCSSVHEMSVKDCISALKAVEKGECY